VTPSITFNPFEIDSIALSTFIINVGESLGLLVGVIASPLLFIHAHQGISLRSNKNE
jgi:hypothetical protein